MDANLSALTDQQRQQVLAAIDDFSSADGDVRDLFCEHWETAKTILNIIKKFLPPPIPGYIETIIAIGDMMYKSCPAKP